MYRPAALRPHRRRGRFRSAKLGIYFWRCKFLPENLYEFSPRGAEERGGVRFSHLFWGFFGGFLLPFADFIIILQCVTLLRLCRGMLCRIAGRFSTSSVDCGPLPEASATTGYGGEPTAYDSGASATSVTSVTTRA